jgi:hypothetical protein
MIKKENVRLTVPRRANLALRRNCINIADDMLVHYGTLEIFEVLICTNLGVNTLEGFQTGSLGLFDTIAVSLTGLVVGGMAIKSDVENWAKESVNGSSKIRT